MAPPAAEVLESHGFGGDRLLKLSRKIANDELGRRGGFLDSERLDDLVAYLALAGVRECVRYDPERVQLRYGRFGRDPFASWLADILAHRVIDWYRSKAEGHGDARRGLHDRIVLTGEKIEEAPVCGDDRGPLRSAARHWPRVAARPPRRDRDLSDCGTWVA